MADSIHIKAANRGKLHRKLHVKAGNRIPLAELLAAQKSSSPAERQEANFAINARKWHHS